MPENLELTVLLSYTEKLPQSGILETLPQKNNLVIIKIK